MRFLHFLLCFACPGLALATQPDPAAYLVPGESLRYCLRWSGMPAGEAVMTVARSTDAGAKAGYAISLSTRSNRLLSAFHRVKDDVESLVDPARFRSLRFQQDVLQGERRKFERVRFLYEEGRAESFRHKQGPKSEEKQDAAFDIGTEEPLQDPLSVMYFLRTLDLAPGTELKDAARVFNRGKVFALSLVVGKESVLRTQNFGDRRVLHVVPTAEFEGVFVSSGRMELWLDAETRVPLKILVEIPVGWATAELVGANNPGLLSRSYRDRRLR